MSSIRDELACFFSGKGMSYEKTALIVAVTVVLVFSAALSNNYIRDGSVAVIDMDNSRFSHEFIDEMNSSPYIKVKTVLNAPADPAKLFYKDRYLAVIYIPAGFEKKRYSLEINNLGVFYDNTNAAQANGVRGALSAVIASLNARIGRSRVQSLGLNREQTEAVMNNISAKERTLFNPTGSYSNSMTMGFLFFFSSIFYAFATLGIVPRLRLEGKWNGLLAGGNPFELILRLTPYVICLTVALVFGLGILRVVNDMSFSGSVPALLLSILLLAVSLGLMSMLFGWGAANPGAASGRMIFFVPGGWILGGVTIPIDILPDWLHVVFNVFPLVWEYRFSRDIILRGASFWDISDRFGGFMIYTGVLALLVCLRFYLERRAPQAHKGPVA